VLGVLIYDLNESGDLAAIAVLGIAMRVHLDGSAWRQSWHSAESNQYRVQHATPCRASR
jgi:hypothetical protein